MSQDENRISDLIDGGLIKEKVVTRLIIQFSGYHENGYKTDKKYEIINIEGQLNMEVVKKEIVKIGGLSPFRGKKEIEIYYMQAF